MGLKVAHTSPYLPDRQDYAKSESKRRCKIMENKLLTFEEALIDRLDNIGELLERIALALEEKDEDDD